MVGPSISVFFSNLNSSTILRSASLLSIGFQLGCSRVDAVCCALGLLCVVVPWNRQTALLVSP